MADIKELVPPLDLCKMIPAGEFADSAFCWIDRGHTCVLPDEVILPEQHPFVELRRYTIQGDEIPAPTLEEIMKDLQKGCCKGVRAELDPCGWEVKLYDYDREDLEWWHGASATFTALTLWLRQKGIDNEG